MFGQADETDDEGGPVFGGEGAECAFVLAEFEGACLACLRYAIVSVGDTDGKWGIGEGRNEVRGVGNKREGGGGVSTVHPCDIFPIHNPPLVVPTHEL